MAKNRIITLLKKLKYLANAQYFNEKDYIFARKEFLKKISFKIDNIKSIYQLGSIEAPGLSDIDLFIIFKNRQRDCVYNYYINRLSSKSQYLFLHNCWFIDECMMKKLPHWFPYFNLFKVYGDKIEIDIRCKDDNNVKVILLTKYLLRKIPFDLIHFSYASNVLNERIMVGMVNSIRYTIELVKDISKKGVPWKWKLFCEEYIEFRKSFFAYNYSERRERLLNFIADSIIIAAELILYVSDNIIKEVVNVNGSGMLNRRKVKIYFRETTLEEMLLFLAKRNLNTMVFPANFIFYPYLWQKSSGRIGRSISKELFFSGTIQNDVNLRKCFSIHAEILEYYNDFSINKFNKAADSYHVLWTPMYDNILIDIFNKGFNTVNGFLGRKITNFK